MGGPILQSRCRCRCGLLFCGGMCEQDCTQMIIFVKRSFSGEEGRGEEMERTNLRSLPFPCSS